MYTYITRQHDELCVPIGCWLNLPDSGTRLRYPVDAPRYPVIYESADTRGVASRRGIFSTAEPTDDHAVCIFPFRRYEVCGMILYAKSSLELIVNNRIGKVGIRPDGRPPSPDPALDHPGPVPPRGSPSLPPLLPRSTSLLTVSLSLPPQRISFSTGVSALQICCPSVCLSVRPCRSTVRIYVRTYVRTYTYVRARAPFPCGI